MNSQGETREELLLNLRSALEEASEMNREEALAAAQGGFVEESINPICEASGLPCSSPRIHIRRR